MHTDVNPPITLAPCVVLFLNVTYVTERKAHLPSTSRPFLFLRRQWWSARFLVRRETPCTASVSKRTYSRTHHRRRRRCGADKGRHRLHEYWSVPLFVSSLWVFFSLMELLPPAPTLRSYWPAETQRPAPLCHVTAADFLLTLSLNMAEWREMLHNLYFLYKYPTMCVCVCVFIF